MIDKTIRQRVLVFGLVTFALAGAVFAAAAERGDAERGRAVFNGKGICYYCHGTDGRPDRRPQLSEETTKVIARLAPNPPDLRNPGGLRLQSDPERFRAIREGHSGTGMLPDTTLTDQEIADTLAYLAQVASRIQEYPVPAGSHPHDVAPAPDGGVWYVAQRSGELGLLDPKTGQIRRIRLGEKSRPHGVIVGPDGAPWLTDSGLNAIVRVDPATEEVTVYPLPSGREGANLNTAAFGKRGVLWFTGQSGIYGRLDLTVGKVEVFDAPKGPGPYGIAAAPDGTVYFVSLAGSYLARLDPDTGAATVIEPPTAKQGARRVWADSKGHLWISEWNVGQLGRYDPAIGAWKEWRLPGEKPGAYAVYVDDRDKVWLTDFGANALVRFDPVTEKFEAFPLPSANAQVRQILGRHGEVWGAESGTDKLVVIRVP
jgi:virginiamycin B lyase